MLRRSKPLGRTSALKPGKPLQRRTPIAPKSAKRIAEDAPGGPREKVRQTTFERDGFTCVAAGFAPDVPCPPGLECDEIQGRGREPGSHLDDTATQSLCRICHMLKTDEPRLAGLLGLYGGAEWLNRIADLPWHVTADAALRRELNEWTRRKATALGRPVPPPQPLDGVKALIRARIDTAVFPPGYGGDAPGPRG